ncbi:MAG TPA: hypothetical protein VMD91_02970 [Candidatus Sulfotelmatobacter sp.]|nr:hypothetical protein [Candidatus Sulfotelmatobacter sp.]
MAATTVYGSAQIKYTVNATASVAIATNYTTAAPWGQAAGASTIYSQPAGNCTAGAAETGATLTFGAITPPTSGYTSCYYKNALLLGVSSNDTSGFKVYEYTDSVATGTAICSYPLNATMAASPTVSGATAAVTYVASCPTVNSVAGVALVGEGGSTAGTGFGGASTPGTGTWDQTATPTATTAGAVGSVFFSAATANGSWLYGGQDISFNVSSAAASSTTTQTNVVTLAVVPN